MSFLKLRGVTRCFGTAAALDGVDLDAKSGSRTAIVGPSGCGKTTLLRLIAGFDQPDAGTISLNGKRLATAQHSVPAHRRGIGLVMQDGALFPHLSVAENIGFGLARRADDRNARIVELTRLVGLDDALLTRRPHQLSGGQQQRVALARALAMKPRIMLLDEPFSALDTGLRAETRKAVAALLGDAGITAILVTHDQEEALSFADQVAVMRDGRFLQVGPPREIYARPASAMVATFLGDALIVPARIEAGLARTPLGPIAIDDASPRADASVVLRPEQIVVEPVSGAPKSGDGPDALVREAEFAGAKTTMVLEIAGQEPSLAAAAPFAVTVTCFGGHRPMPGDRVRLRFTSAAYVLPSMQ
ncbi:ABC transporter ATP-binding protein [Jiella sp. MQZ9-1]|uniref:ABC transporter ATP-binding protein n=1 Tax=Jiella flava TaxID=2816857 RepID=A0A939G2H1_9HYPH|nr:ABC transporter ATP-binding protein [Jiella flava]MBO0664511.1 ABC transporter ATP-binding protein [Jiella flava]MCD2473157.1 ABC transporter ATP-binding protein [Jiella flava]